MLFFVQKNYFVIENKDTLYLAPAAASSKTPVGGAIKPPFAARKAPAIVAAAMIVNITN
jgi:hypothetical protein